MNPKIKTRIQLGLIALLAIFAISLVLSQKTDPSNPPLFALKRIQEKAFLLLKSTPSQKVDYMSSLLDNRLVEIKNQVYSKNYGQILPSASRYSTLAGQITETIVANNMKDKVSYITSQFLSHKKVLKDIYVVYPKNTDNMEYKYIEDDSNYLDLYLDKLSNNLREII
ncbi:hypothetical protein HYW43_01070 [Candidatus Daviesbacteria bacterium]|nr:hypothetical protein [Candidatus Daviesbacteria bacterium]